MNSSRCIEIATQGGGDSKTCTKYFCGGEFFQQEQEDAKSLLQNKDLFLKIKGKEQPTPMPTGMPGMWGTPVMLGG